MRIRILEGNGVVNGFVDRAVLDRFGAIGVQYCGSEPKPAHAHILPGRLNKQKARSALCSNGLACFADPL
jgi:hypothetical protein